MSANEELIQRIKDEVDKIRPRLQMDGGDVSFVKFEDGVLTVELQGACKGCPMSAITLQMGIERTIKQAIPEVKSVEAEGIKVPDSLKERLKQMYGDS